MKRVLIGPIDLPRVDTRIFVTNIIGCANIGWVGDGFGECARISRLLDQETEPIVPKVVAADRCLNAEKGVELKGTPAASGLKQLVYCLLLRQWRLTLITIVGIK